jgi:hypothetical protein
MKSVLNGLLICGVLFAQQSRGPLTDQRIMGLVADGVSQQEVIRIINTAPLVDFVLRPDATDAMTKAGVSEEILKAMAARESGLAPAASPGSTPETTRRDPVSVASSSGNAIIAVPMAPTSQPRIATTGYGQTGETHKLTYDGGSIANLKTGANVKLFLNQNQIHIAKDGLDLITIPPTAVTEISYGQDVHRRVGAAIGLATVSLGVGALMALTKSKKHFIGITWDDGHTKGGAAFQADKRDYRGVLAGLEGITGRQALNSEAMTVKN